MSALKLWHSKLFHIAGQELRLKVKSLSFLEAPEFLGHMEELRKNLKATGDGGQTIQAIYATVDPSFVSSCFQKWVRPDGPAIEIDEGEPLRTGEDVYGIATTGLVMDVLWAIQGLAIQTGQEGKGSASPSTSSPAETGNGDSTAQPTEREVGAGPSTVTPIRAGIA